MHTAYGDTNKPHKLQTTKLAQTKTHMQIKHKWTLTCAVCVCCLCVNCDCNPGSARTKAPVKLVTQIVASCFSLRHEAGGTPVGPFHCPSTSPTPRARERPGPCPQEPRRRSVFKQNIYSVNILSSEVWQDSTGSETFPFAQHKGPHGGTGRAQIGPQGPERKAEGVSGAHEPVGKDQL